MLEQRNWLVHRAHRENRGILASMEQVKKLLQQCETIAIRSIELNKTLATELERYVRESGVDPAIIDAEADRLARSWGLLD